LTYAESRVGEKTEKDEDIIQVRRYEKNYSFANEFQQVFHGSLSLSMTTPAVNPAGTPHWNRFDGGSGRAALTIPAYKENGGVREDSAIPARAIWLTDQGSPCSNRIGASIHWTDRARGNEPARIPHWHSGQYEVD
jgi:hypothetical protein